MVIAVRSVQKTVIIHSYTWLTKNGRPHALHMHGYVHVCGRLKTGQLLQGFII